MSLTGKVAIVTGASRGIGRGIALALAAAGATVYGTATTPEGAAGITSYLKEAGLSGEGRALNVTDIASIEKLAEEIQNPAILVNNAGITRDNLLMRMSNEEWDDVIAANLTSVFRVTKAFIRPMIKARFGRIINISSIVGVAGAAGQANYAAAKAGIIGFSKSLAQEIASRNITVNVIAPGFIKTDMTDCLPEATRAAILEKIPSGAVGSVDDIAAMALFLASDQARYITGQTLHINGGMLMT